MKAYKVIARKWRPQNFDQIVGQKHVALTLKNSIKYDRVGHAFLFTGVRGVGKTTTARILAKALNCEQLRELNPCNECPSCLSIQKGTHPDVIEIDGASNTGVDDVKALREASRYLPSRGNYKIYIIDEVHMLSEKAFNALLKILEEPPAHVKFIFATTDPHKIPITIKSRCQIYDFKSIDLDLIFKHLGMICEHEGIKTTEEALYLIARKAEGSMRDAQSLTDQVIAFAGNHLEKNDVLEVLGLTDSESLIETTDAILERNVGALLQQTDQLVQRGVNLIQYYKELIHHFHQLLIIRNSEHPARILKLPGFEFESYQKQALRFDESFPRLYELLIEGFDGLKISQFPRIIFELNLIKLARFKPATSLETILTMLKKLENTLEQDSEIGELSINIFDMLQQGNGEMKPVNLLEQQQKSNSKKKIENSPTSNWEQAINKIEAEPAEVAVESTVQTVVEPVVQAATQMPIEAVIETTVEAAPIEETPEPVVSEIIAPEPVPEPEITPVKDVVTDHVFDEQPGKNGLPGPRQCQEIIAQFEAVVGQFFQQSDESYHYFKEETYLPLREEDGVLIYRLPKNAETMIMMHPEFPEVFTRWFQGKEQGIELQFVERQSDLNFAAYKKLQHQYRLEAEDKAIRNLENVKQLQSTFNVTIKQIKRKKS